jgi:hypothetical protein
VGKLLKPGLLSCKEEVAKFSQTIINPRQQNFQLSYVQASNFPGMFKMLLISLRVY